RDARRLSTRWSRFVTSDGSTAREIVAVGLTEIRPPVSLPVGCEAELAHERLELGEPTHVPEKRPPQRESDVRRGKLARDPPQKLERRVRIAIEGRPVREHEQRNDLRRAGLRGQIGPK